MPTIIYPFLLLIFCSTTSNAQVIGAEPLPYLPFSKWTDFDNDGSLELISRQNDYLKVFKVNGFTTTLHDEVSNTHGSFSPVDIDGDGFPEIMVNNVNYLYYYPNDQGDLKPGKIHIYNVPLSGPDITGHFAQDMDNDGDADVILIMDDSRFYFMENVNGEIKADEKVEIANLNVGGGSLIKFCDYNQDGYMDMIVRQVYRGVHLFLNTGDKQYSVTRLLTNDNQEDVAITDFDLDGYPDIIVAIKTYTSSSPYGSIIIRMNEASVGVPFYSLANLYYPQSIKVINLDDDPEPEILIGDDQSLSMADLQNGALVKEVLWGTPGNEFGAPSADIEVGDYDHDGKLDVLHMVFNSESSLLLTDFNTPLEAPYSCSQSIDTLLCPGGNVHLSGQGAVNVFASNYPHCKYLNGSLTVDGGVTDIKDISHIVSVKGSLLIENTQLDSIYDIDLLNVRDDVIIRHNPQLLKIRLPALEIVNGHLNVSDNESLTEILGPEVMKKLASAEISDNPELAIISGFDEVRLVSSIKFIDNPSLDSLKGFKGVIDAVVYLDNSPVSFLNSFSSADTMVISNSAYLDMKPFRFLKPNYLRLDNITSLTQLTHLTQGTNDRIDLSIRNCPDLEKTGLPLKIGHLELSGNALLSDISSLNVQNTVVGDVIIKDNPVLTNLIGLQNASRIAGKVLIDNNTSLSSINSLNAPSTEFIDTLTITNNPQLSLCHTNFICKLLWGSIPHTIGGNDEGCLNGPVVQAACGITTSVENPFDKDEIFVYPNPASDLLHVNAPTLPQQLIILSTNGHEILRVNNSYEVSLPDLSPGIYFLKVILNDKTVFHTFSIAH